MPPQPNCTSTIGNELRSSTYRPGVTMLIQRRAKHYSFIAHFGTAFASRYNMPAGLLPHRNPQCLSNAVTGKVLTV
jgi:hypothetical protein